MRNCHGNEHPYRGRDCSQSFLHSAGLHRRIRRGRHRRHVACNGETLTKKQSDALAAYNNSKSQFEQVLAQRRAQISSKQGLPNLPGQALYLARNNMISAYKDLTDAMPSRIGGPNKYGIPPAYFSADNEPLLDEYRKLST